MRSVLSSAPRPTWFVRAAVGIIAVAVLASTACRRAAADRNVEAPEPPAVVAESPPWTVTSDPVKIFQKAFWRSPTADDEIVHGERREWLGPDGLGKWQWFLVVKPSPELVKHLRDDNAFGLMSVDSIPEIAEPPAWFTFKATEVDIFLAPTANLRFIFFKSDNLLLASDSGSVFRPGAPEPERAAHQSSPRSGRIPATAPPNPRLMK